MRFFLMLLLAIFRVIPGGCPSAGAAGLSAAYRPIPGPAAISSTAPGAAGRRVSSVVAAHPRFSSRLYQLIAAKQAKAHTGRSILSAGAPPPPPAGQSSTEFICIILEFSRVADTDLSILAGQGGRIVARHGDLVAIELPVDHIIETVDRLEHLRFARLPASFFPTEIISEGASASAAAAFQTAGLRGAGVKVAVIDVGFKGLSEAQTAGELPGTIITHDFTGKGLQTQYKHGTGCAEIVHDMAPEAQLHLLKIAGEVDFINAFAYCRENRIDIISMSIGTMGTGPGDGTGPVAALCDQAREQGILVVDSAGNYANMILGGNLYGSHWEGRFTDSNQDGFHEFLSNDNTSYYTALAAMPEQDDDGNPEDSELTIVMRWDDWPSASIDYDMCIKDYQTAQEISCSTTVQDGSQPPLEAIVLDLPDSEDYLHYYALIVTCKNGSPANTKLELYLGGSSLFVPFYSHSDAIVTSASSLSEPGDAASVLTVGAIHVGNWLTGPQEDFSSQGPTNDWAGSSARIKPDISGPDGVANLTYPGGTFQGTSAAAPHVAGAAALILSGSPCLSVQQLADILKEKAIDMGAAGVDNLYGRGRLALDGAMIPDLLDTDQDDDGLEDLAEDQNQDCLRGDAETDPAKPDTDEDGLQDGTELGLTPADISPSTNTALFQPDLDPAGSTDPLKPDSDADGIIDGNEDLNHNGRLDQGETDPDWMIGDLNHNREIDLVDAILVLHTLGRQDIETPLNPKADVDGNGKMAVPELLYILRQIAGF